MDGDEHTGRISLPLHNRSIIALRMLLQLEHCTAQCLVCQMLFRNADKQHIWSPWQQLPGFAAHHPGDSLFRRRACWCSLRKVWLPIEQVTQEVITRHGRAGT